MSEQQTAAPVRSAWMSSILGEGSSEGGTPTPAPIPQPANADGNPAPEPAQTGATEGQTANQEPAPIPAPQASEPADDEDARFLKRYNKLHGTEYTSVDEIGKPKNTPTKEELEAAERQEKDEALSFALKAGIFQREDYDKYVQDKAKSTRELALAVFSARYAEAFPDAKPGEAEEKFSDYFDEGESETSWKRKLREKEMAELAQSHLSKYDKIEKHVDEYRNVKSMDEQVKSFRKKINEVAETLPSQISFEIPMLVDGKEVKASYPFTVTPEIKAEIAKLYNKNNEGFNRFASNREKPATESEILKAMESTVTAKYFNDIIAHVASEHGKAVLQNIKNIPTRQTTPSLPTGGMAPAAPTPKRSPWLSSIVGN